MIRRLLPWVIIAALAAVVFFVGSLFWQAWNLPETQSASVTETVDAPAEAVWLVLNTAGVLKERFDEVEFEDVVEDDQGLVQWTSRHEDRNYYTRFVRTRALQPADGGPWVYEYTITPEDVPVLTTRTVEIASQPGGQVEVSVTDVLVIEDRTLRMWMGVLGMDSGVKNEMKAITSLVDSAKAAL
ncbi:MAG: hypothetical protein ACPG42_03245 [Alphaproteobacteria bacterium]